MLGFSGLLIDSFYFALVHWYREYQWSEVVACWLTCLLVDNLGWVWLFLDSCPSRVGLSLGTLVPNGTSEVRFFPPWYLSCTEVIFCWFKFSACWLTCWDPFWCALLVLVFWGCCCCLCVVSGTTCAALCGWIAALCGFWIVLPYVVELLVWWLILKCPLDPYIWSNAMLLLVTSLN
jgi:hypothetical protein